jgi:hypothetical protein
VPRPTPGRFVDLGRRFPHRFLRQDNQGEDAS